MNFTRGNVTKSLNIGKDRMDESLTLAMNKLTHELRNDPEYFRSWKANIAVQMQDYAYYYKKDHKKKYLTQDDIHTISNDAAAAFLRLLIR